MALASPDMRLPVLLLLALAGAVAAAEPPADPEIPLGDVSLVDEHRWIEAVSRRRQKLATAPQTVEVLSDADLLTGTPAATLPDRLRYVPGIDVYQARAGQYDIGLRGYNGLLNNRLLVVAGDREFRQEEFGSVVWRGALNLSDVQRVEIAKGPSSVAWGANAFGGVIALAERVPGDHHELHTVGEAGERASGDGDVTALGPLGGGFTYKASAGWTVLHDLPGVRSGVPYQPSGRTADTAGTDLDALRYGGTVGYLLPAGNRIEARYGGIDLRSWELVDDLDSGSNATSSRYDDLGVRLIGPWGQIGHLRSYADKTYSNQKRFYVPAEDYRYTQAGFENVEDTTRAQFNLPMGLHQLSLGGELYRWRSRSNLWSTSGRVDDHATWAEVVTTNRAVFAEDQLAVGGGLLATAGLRLDDHSRTDLNASPRLALNLDAGGDQYWLLSWSTGYRLPTPIESYLSEYYFRSDPDLRPETISAVELGWQLRPPGDELSLTANAFFNRSNRQIWLRPLPESEMAANFQSWFLAGDVTRPPGPFFAFRNLDNPATVLGLELSARSRMGDLPVTLWANGTGQYFRYRDSIVYRSQGFDPGTGTPIFRFDRDLGHDINAPPRWKLNLGCDWARGMWTAGIAGRYVSGRRVFSFADSYFRTTGVVEVQDIPAYVACDLSAGMSFGAGRFVRLAVLDLFGSGHYEQFRSSPTTLTNEREPEYTSEIGTTAVLQAGWSF